MTEIAAPDGGHVKTLVRDVQPAFDRLFAGRDHILLAVSGGPDSMALLQLASHWRSSTSFSTRPRFSVVTIDHGLRSGSAAEAEMVARECDRLSVPHSTLLWHGPKPKTGVQAAARAARRALLRQHLANLGCSAVATAHTADDQSETVLMRLARGSGVDGLGGMRPLTRLDGGLVLLRPLLGVRKERLISALTAWGCSWAEDPSNRSEAFERVRIRRAREVLATETVPLHAAALCRSAARLARAADALEAYTALTWRTRPSSTDIFPEGHAVLDWGWLMSHPEDIRLRLLAGLLEAVGGPRPMSLGQLEQHTIGRDWAPVSGTLNRVRLSGAPIVRLIPEAGRAVDAPAPINLSPGQTLVWDGRFRLTVGAQCPASLQVRAIEAGVGGSEVLAEYTRAVAPSGLSPPRILPRQPLIWDGTVLAAAPAIGFCAPGYRSRGVADIRATFIGPDFADLPAE